MQSNVTADLKAATSIINFDVVPSTFAFNFIYRGTNEKLSEYEHFFAKKKRMLSVIASGEQILNAILEGVEEVDAFDVCSFPKYYLFLKKAGIQALTREEYIGFFYEKLKEPYCQYVQLYNKMRPYLDGDYLFFWDSLFKKFSWKQMQSSLLFFRDPLNEEENIKNNKYLEPTNFEKMKELLTKVRIRAYDGDILKIARKFKQESDLIYLSNISFYTGIKAYLKMHLKLKLAPGGVILSYNMKLQPEDIKPKYLRSGTFRYVELSDNDGLTVYQRKA